MNMQDIWILSPQLALTGIVLAVIILDLLIVNKRLLVYFSVIGLIIPLMFSLNIWFGLVGNISNTEAFYGTINADRFALFFHFVLLGITALVIAGSVGYIERMKGLQGEFLSLILFSLLGMMILVSAKELITIYVSLELTALPIAALAAFRKNSLSIEAGLKFIILSAVSSAILLYGIVFLYGYVGTTDLGEIFYRLQELPRDSNLPFGSPVMLLSVSLLTAGFAFKMAIVPWQMWVPDVYQGAPTPVGAFLSTASKASAFAVVIRLLYTSFAIDEMLIDWAQIFAVLAVVSMIFGNLVALRQSDIKRLLGYSTITQAGYILIGLASVSASVESGSLIAGPQSALYYLAGYAFTNLAVFLAVIVVINRTGNSEINGLNGLLSRSPWLSIMLGIGLLSLLGIPPSVGFMSKVIVFSAAINSGLLWLAIAGVINTVISAFYYLKIIRAIFFESANDDTKVDVSIPVLIPISIATFGVILFGVVPWLILEIVEKSLDIL